jgi:hypothetical protein
MKTFIAALALLSSGSVLAWGNTGHRVVGEVAAKFLDPHVGYRAHQILKGESLARASTWPDEIKSEPANYSHTYSWHYTTWAQDDHEHSEHEETSSTGLLLTAINQQLAVLSDPKESDDKKAFALRFIVHLIGDVHMPLHVGGGLDQGGNLCKVSYMGRPYSLHSLWDEGMIDFTNLSFTELTRFITEGRSVAEISSIQSGTVVDWAEESKNIVATLYPENVMAPQDPISTRTYCGREVSPEAVPKLSYQYAYQFMPIVEQRLFEAGVRLAMLLNENLK